MQPRKRLQKIKEKLKKHRQTLSAGGHALRSIDWKLTALALLLILNSVMMLVFCIVTVRTHQKMSQVGYEMSYLSDTTSLMLDDISTMKTDIQASLDAQSSYLESWDISLDAMHFADHSYTVSISVIPREWTENTRASIYFGSKNFPLQLDDYRYTGTADLTLDESYDGNVTILFEEGKSRKTEVLENYRDVVTDLTNVLYGRLFDAPVYEDGQLLLHDSGYLQLDGGDFFIFDTLEMVVEADQEELTAYDLRAMASGETPAQAEDEVQEDDDTILPEGSRQTDLQERLVGPEELTWLAYSYTLEEQLALSPGCQIRLYLRARTNDGYTFTYDLYQARIDAEENETPAAEGENIQEPKISGGHIAEDSIDYSANAAVYDPFGGCYQITEEQ